MRRLWSEQSRMGELEPGRLLVRALRLDAQEAGDAHQQGQVVEHGQLVE